MQKFFNFAQIQNLSYFKQPLFGFKSILRKIDSRWVRSSLNHNVYAIWALTGGGLFSKAQKYGKVLCFCVCSLCVCVCVCVCVY